MSHTRRRKPRYNAEREYRLTQTAQLLLERRPYREIADRLGVSVGTVANDAQTLLERWRECQGEAVAEQFGRAVAITHEVERVSWEAWHASKQPKEITTAEQKSTLVTDPESGVRSSVPIEAKSAVRREERDPNPAFLAHIEWAAEYRAKLFGLYAPVKQETSVTEVTPEALEAREVARVLSARPDLSDRLTALQADLQAAIQESSTDAMLEAGPTRPMHNMNVAQEIEYVRRRSINGASAYEE